MLLPIQFMIYALLFIILLWPLHPSEAEQRLEHRRSHIYAAEIFSGIDLSNLIPEDRIFLQEYLKQQIQEEINAYEEIKQTNHSRIFTNNIPLPAQPEKVAVEAIHEVAKLKPYKRQKMAEAIVDIVRATNGE
jgi:hypothetical protein